MAKPLRPTNPTADPDPFGLRWRKNINTTPCTIVIRYDKDGTAIKITENETKTTVTELVRRYHKDEPDIREGINAALDKLFAHLNTGYTGKLVCVKSDFLNTFAPGKVYHMQDGIIDCNDGFYNPEGPRYKTLDDLNTIGGHYFIPYVGENLSPTWVKTKLELKDAQSKNQPCDDGGC